VPSEPIRTIASGDARAAPLILALDSAGSSCAAAVAAGDEVLAAAHFPIAHGQAEALLPLVERVMREARVVAPAIELVVVTTGPGSFTGIRVGLAAARGIALGLDVPLFGVTGFDAALSAVGDNDAGAEAATKPLLVALESRRADLYIRLFDAMRRPQCPAAALLPDALCDTVAGVFGKTRLAITGDAASRAAAALAVGGIPGVVVEGAPPVVGALRAALRRWRRGAGENGGENGSSATPFYLRPPDVTVTAGAIPVVAR